MFVRRQLLLSDEAKKLNGIFGWMDGWREMDGME